MARTVAIAFLLSSLLTAGLNADEPANSRQPEERSLDRLQFPLPEQATFEAELKLLEDVLAAKLRDPAPRNYTRDRVLGHELGRVLELMRYWPSEKFCEPLITHFTTSNRYVIKCARALVAYRDEDLRDVVFTRKDYKWSDSGGCFIVVESVARILNEPFPPEQPFRACEDLIPEKVDRRGEKTFDWPPGVTIPGAARQLKDEQLSIRLQAWLWLARLGIVATTEAVVEAWPRLTEEQRETIAFLDPDYCGRQRLLALYERIAEHSPEVIQNSLLVRRVELGSEPAKIRARRMVHLRRNFPVKLTEAPGESALDALCKAPDPVDIPLLLELGRCSELGWPLLRIANRPMRALAGIDHPDAIEIIGEALYSPTADLFLVSDLQIQAAKDLRHRDLYLAVIVRGLHHPELTGKKLVQLLGLFECMSGRSFGCDDRWRLASDDEVDLAEARKITDGCLEWFAEHMAARDRDERSQVGVTAR